MTDISILLAISAILTVLILVLRHILKSQSKRSNVPEAEAPQTGTNRVRDNAARRAQLARNRGLRLRERDVNHTNNEVNDDANERQAATPEIEFPEGKIGAKKRAKLTAKAEKKAAREAEEQQRAEKKKKLELEDAERKILEEKEKAEEKAREEAEKKAREEKERKEYEEYLKLKETFSIEEEGFEEGEEDSQNLLQEFVNYIKEKKVVILEDLAAHFKLKTQACIDRIKDLQQDNVLTGVIDDRGKFIYISQSEIENVAKFIRQRGRVSIAEIAEHSNELISLV